MPFLERKETLDFRLIPLFSSPLNCCGLIFPINKQNPYQYSRQHDSNNGILVINPNSMTNAPLLPAQFCYSTKQFP